MNKGRRGRDKRNGGEGEDHDLLLFPMEDNVGRGTLRCGEAVVEGGGKESGEETRQAVLRGGGRGSAAFTPVGSLATRDTVKGTGQFGPEDVATGSKMRIVG